MPLQKPPRIPSTALHPRPVDLATRLAQLGDDRSEFGQLARLVPLRPAGHTSDRPGTFRSCAKLKALAWAAHRVGQAVAAADLDQAAAARALVGAGVGVALGPELSAPIARRAALAGSASPLKMPP